MSFFNRRPFSHVEATRVTNAYAACTHSQMVLDTCPIRAACQKDPTLKAFDDLAASWTIGASSLYPPGSERCRVAMLVFYARVH